MQKNVKKLQYFSEGRKGQSLWNFLPNPSRIWFCTWAAVHLWYVVSLPRNGEWRFAADVQILVVTWDFRAIFLAMNWAIMLPFAPPPQTLLETPERRICETMYPLARPIPLNYGCVPPWRTQLDRTLASSFIAVINAHTAGRHSKSSSVWKQGFAHHQESSWNIVRPSILQKNVWSFSKHDFLRWTFWFGTLWSKPCVTRPRDVGPKDLDPFQLKVLLHLDRITLAHCLWTQSQKPTISINPSDRQKPTMFPKPPSIRILWLILEWHREKIRKITKKTCISRTLFCPVWGVSLHCQPTAISWGSEYESTRRKMTESGRPKPLHAKCAKSDLVPEPNKIWTNKRGIELSRNLHPWLGKTNLKLESIYKWAGMVGWLFLGDATLPLGHQRNIKNRYQSREHQQEKCLLIT